MSTEGTGSRGQTGHSDSGQKCAHFTVTSANGSSSIAHPNIKIRWRLREHPTYNCRYCESEFEYRKQLLHHVTTMHRDRQFACPQCQRSYIYVKNLTEDVNKMHTKLYFYFLIFSFIYYIVTKHLLYCIQGCIFFNSFYINRATL